MDKLPKDAVMDAVPGSLPPSGWLYGRAVSPDGSSKDIWWNPTARECDPNPVVKELTPDQLERLKRVRWAVREHDHFPWDVWLKNFGSERLPEREIRIWEGIVAAYKAEVAERRPCTPQARHMLYHSLIIGSKLNCDADLVIASHPEFKGVSGLARALARLGLEILERVQPGAFPDPKPEDFKPPEPPQAKEAPNGNSRMPPPAEN